MNIKPLIFCLFATTVLTACKKDPRLKFVELLDSINNYPMVNCKTTDKTLHIKINNILNDTLLFYSDNGCIWPSSCAYYMKNSNGDFVFNAIETSCFAPSSRIDTIFPFQSTVFALDSLILADKFKRTPYLRIGIEHEKMHSTGKNKMAELFLGIDPFTHQIFQLDTIVTIAN